MKSIFLASALIVAIVVGVQATAYAGGSSPDNTRGRSGKAAATTGPKTLLRTYFRSGSGGTTLTSGFSIISTARVNCDNPAGCSIGVESMVQIQPGSATTLWAICPSVDDVSMSPPCPYQGLLPAVGSYVTGNGRSNIKVPSGIHVVKTRVYVSDSGTLGSWASDLSVYKP